MINSILTPELEANFELPKDDFKKFLVGLTEELAEEYNKRARQKAREEQKELERVALNKVMDVMENYFRLFSSNEEIVKVACKTSQKALMQISETLRKAGDGKKCDFYLLDQVQVKIKELCYLEDFVLQSYLLKLADHDLVH